MELDPDVEAFKKSNRRPLWLGLGVVVATLGLAGGYSVSQGGAVRRDLERDGYTNVTIKVKGPFEYEFSGTKASSQCSGHVTRMPFSSSSNELCASTAPPAPPKPPPRPQAEVLAENLKKLFSDRGLPVTAHCPEVAKDAVKLTCSVAMESGTPLDLELGKDGGDWSVKRPTQIISRARMSGDISKELEGKFKSPVAVDCGAGLLGYEANDHLTCTGKKKGASKEAHIEVTFNATGGYTWKADI